jgi:hypothetical protein
MLSTIAPVSFATGAILVYHTGHRHSAPQRSPALPRISRLS